MLFHAPLGGAPLLCQPALEFGGALVGKVERQPTDSVPHGQPLLGLSVVVAPISEASRPRKQDTSHLPVSRDVSGLLGEKVPPPQGGPSFAQYYPGRLTRKASSA